MRLNLLLLLAIIALSWSATLWLDNQAPKTQLTQKSLSEFSFTDLNGKTYQSNDFQGKIVILNFWASWCAPCAKEFPTLLELANRYKKDLVLIALSSDVDKTAMANFLKKMGDSWQRSNIFIALDQDDITGKVFGTTRLPETLITDKSLKIREKLIGAEWTPEQAEEIIEKIR